jgi:hypothetical protein
MKPGDFVWYKHQAPNLSLINDGAIYRVKRHRSYETFSLRTSPLEPEHRGGGEGYALREVIARFCEP